MVYIVLDQNNPIDREIQQHLVDHRSNGYAWHQDTIIKFVLNKRLVSKYRFYGPKKANGIDNAIEVGIKKRIEKTGMSREEVIREALCIHFNIPKVIPNAVHEK